MNEQTILTAVITFILGGGFLRLLDAFQATRSNSLTIRKDELTLLREFNVNLAAQYTASQISENNLRIANNKLEEDAIRKQIKIEDLEAKLKACNEGNKIYVDLSRLYRIQLERNQIAVPQLKREGESVTGPLGEAKL